MFVMPAAFCIGEAGKFRAERDLGIGKAQRRVK